MSTRKEEAPPNGWLEDLYLTTLQESEARLHPRRCCELGTDGLVCRYPVTLERAPTTKASKGDEYFLYCQAHGAQPWEDTVTK